ncbi:MAG TPA: FAD-dependent oxidoreductase [Usitatibacter sp.]|nr:FAD-dependent oxidoreductase [Usitatibacter sp.]
MNRRAFLAAISALVAQSPYGCARASRRIDGQLLGPDLLSAHKIRQRNFPAPTQVRRTGILIVGGGLSGLSAAWWLARQGYRDYAIVEGETEVGGNSRYGESTVTRFPWGAHYLPLLTREARELRMLLEDLKVITGARPNGDPEYDPRFIVSPPQERLFQYGQWQPGLRPLVADRGKAEFARFDDVVRELREARGADGRPAFTTPSAHSSRDPRFTSLDRVSMAAWLQAHGFRDAALRWFIEYACRDDFGTMLDETSAWAGLHYFAGRKIRGDYADGAVLTWPEGNGFLVRRLREKLDTAIHTGHWIFRVDPSPHGVEARSWSGTHATLWQADQAVLAIPQMVLPHLLATPARVTLGYAPWLVANLHVSELPGGAQPAWDNVIYDSPGLGYVVATHQALTQRVSQSVLTYYLPFAGAPSQARDLLLRSEWTYWRDIVLADIGRAHPDIGEVATRLDVWRWGHGMVKPAPKLLFGDDLRAARKSVGRMHFAHSDLSGMSLAEEAHYWGVEAARSALQRA